MPTRLHGVVTRTTITSGVAEFYRVLTMQLYPSWNQLRFMLRSLSSTKVSLRSESHALLRHTRKCNFIYAHNKSAGFPAPILTKFRECATALSKIHPRTGHEGPTGSRK